MRNALIVADVMQALDAEALGEGAAVDLRFGATAIRRRNAMVEDHGDAVGIRHLDRITPIDRKKITVVENDGIDCDDNEVPRRNACALAGPRQNFIEDGASHHSLPFELSAGLSTPAAAALVQRDRRPTPPISALRSILSIP